MNVLNVALVATTQTLQMKQKQNVVTERLINGNRLIVSWYRKGVEYMILYSKNNDKVHCNKCKPPKFNGKNSYLDHITGDIDDIKTKFWFSVRNNGSNFYFLFDNQWYRTSIVTNDGFDVHTWLYDKGEKLFSIKQ